MTAEVCYPQESDDHSHYAAFLYSTLRFIAFDHLVDTMGLGLASIALSFLQPRA